MKPKLSALLLLVLALSIISHKSMKSEFSHNCRIWAFVMSDTTTIPAQLINAHLLKLRDLGYWNSDGWGLGYYLSIADTKQIAVIRRGEPGAPFDPRYLDVMNEFIGSAPRSAIAHVRRASSGPLSGIPNPHPFLRQGFFRDFEMLLAHNGTIPISPLYSLIQTSKPGYLALNPADYSPDYLDSDLLAIFIMQMIDLHADSSIESCIKIAINKLANIMPNSDAQFNFAMTDGHTLWAVKFSLGISDAISLYYYPDDIESDLWIVASEPLDTTKSWSAIPCSTLVRLVPDQPPVFMSLIDQDSSAYFNPLLEIAYDNPGRLPVQIRYRNNTATSIRIYDISGRLVKDFKLESHGQGSVTWDGRDRNNKFIGAGNYFCRMALPDTTCSIKLTILP